MLPPVLAAALPPADAGSLPQTATKPSANTETFAAEMALLWAAVQQDRPSLAFPAFFPLSAYLQVKALPNDNYDWHTRLYGQFAADVQAAHQLLGPDPASAHLVETLVPSWQAGWIVPGTCYNAGSYWHVPGSRMVYEQGGREASFGIASLISWRGLWYVVHLGAINEYPGEAGVVDSPSSGTGSFGPPGGC